MRQAYQLLLVFIGILSMLTSRPSLAAICWSLLVAIFYAQILSFSTQLWFILSIILDCWICPELKQEAEGHGKVTIYPWVLQEFTWLVFPCCNWNYGRVKSFSLSEGYPTFNPQRNPVCHCCNYCSIFVFCYHVWSCCNSRSIIDWQVKSLVLLHHS